MGDDIYNFDKRVSSIVFCIIFISRNVSNVYFCLIWIGWSIYRYGDGCCFCWIYNNMFIIVIIYGVKMKRGSMMRVEVWGGVGEYGCFCYFVKNKEMKIVFDCGINWFYEDSYLKIEREVVLFLDVVFLLYIYEDYMMGLFLLVKYGYKKKIWMICYMKE